MGQNGMNQEFLGAETTHSSHFKEMLTARVPHVNNNSKRCTSNSQPLITK